jgi:UDP-N-acetylmuramate--alanine ligase
MKEGIPYKNMYFLGIGGIGMSALARYYAAQGVCVWGYDAVETELTKKMVNEGINIHYMPEVQSIPKNIDVLVYTPAIPSSNPEFEFFRSSGITMLKRSEAMAALVNNHFCIAIAGTHGKTTISALTTHIFKTANRRVLAFVGGIMKNYNKNMVFSNDPEVCIVEADEFDRSFLKLTPQIALVSAIDADHLDIYNTFDELQSAFVQFVSQTKPLGNVVVQKDINEMFAIENKHTYGLHDYSGLHVQNLKFESHQFVFDLHIGNKCLSKKLIFTFPGLHNLENALAAISTALLFGINIEHIKEALQTFQGIHRRFDIRVLSDKYIYIDDYAHHPKEIDALVHAVKHMFPGKRITGVFQPHLFSRTRDFASDFAESLQQLDEILLLEIYPAREEPIEGINSQYLFNLIEHPNKQFISKTQLTKLIEKQTTEVLLTIGAGDIDKLVMPLEEIINKKLQREDGL